MAAVALAEAGCRSSVDRAIRVREVGGSIPLTPTKTGSMQKLTKKELKAKRHEERVKQEERNLRRIALKTYAFWVACGLLLVASIAVIYFITWRQPPVPQESLTQPVNQALPAVTAADYHNGPEKASVTLIEYGDFQCPACAHYAPMITKLKTDYKDSLRIVFRHFPLTNTHKNAQAASQAAHAASKQGKFWEYHDVLYKNQAAWSASDEATSAFTDYASQLGLNIDQFLADMNSEETLNVIQAHREGGIKAGVPGTPTFHVNGRQVVNPTTYEDFKLLVDQARKRAAR